MSRSCIECVHNNPNDPSDLAYACLNCSWPTFAGEPTNFKPKSQTNADRIRAMTDEELARTLAIGCDETRECPTICAPIYPYDEVVESCEKCWLEWLREEGE